MKPRIIFFGTDQFAVLVLNRLVDDKRFKIVGVVTHVPASPIDNYAQTVFELKVTESQKFGQKFQNEMKSLKPDVGVLASFGKILPKEILAIPKHGILNIHPSLLPRYRGPTPVPTAILNDEKETGVTIFKMDEKLDHGPIIAQFFEPINPDDTSESLLKKLFSAGAEVLLAILPAYLEDRIDLRAQEDKQADYTKKFSRNSGKINWSKSDKEIDRLIRAMTPWPGAWTEIKIPDRQPKSIRYRQPKKRLKVLKAHLENKNLIFDQVQLEGKNPVSWKQFQEGYPKAKIIKKP
jgi:methionyl-tRNA formyltransferase